MILKSTSESAQELEAKLKGISGLTDIKSSWEEGSPEAHIIFNRDQLSRFNLNLEDVANILRSKVRGDVATEFREGDEEIDIRVWNEDIDRDSIEDLAKHDNRPCMKKSCASESSRARRHRARSE